MLGRVVAAFFVLVGVASWLWIHPTSIDGGASIESAARVQERIEPPAAHDEPSMEVVRSSAPVSRSTTVRARRDHGYVPIERAKWMSWTDEEERASHGRRNVPLCWIDARSIEIRPESDGSVLVPDGAGNGLLGIVAQGCAPTGRVIHVGEGDVDLPVESGPTFRAKVLDTQDHPIAGARVVMRYDLFNAHEPDDPTPLDVRCARAMFENVALSDATGIAAVEQRALGSFIVAVSKADMGSLVYAIADMETPVGEEVRFVLGPAAALTGRVVDDETNRPLGEVRLESGTFVHRDYAGGSGIAYSADDGSFRIDALAAEAGLQLVTAMLEGYAAETVTIGSVVRGETKKVDIRMKRGTSFVGYVRDPDGKPLTEVRLNALDPDRYPGGFEESRTDSEGRFEFTAIARDRPFVVVPQKSGYGIRWISVSAPWKQPFDIQLESDSPLHGKLIAESYPLSHPQVRIVREDRFVARTFERWVDADPASGEFTFLDVPIGTFHFDAVVEGYAPTRRAGVPVASSAEREPVEVKLERGFSIEGRVVDAATTKPIAEATVYWGDTREDSRDIAGVLETAATTDAAGQFIIFDAPLGRRIVLLVRRDGYATQVVDFEAASATTRVTRELRMQPEGVLAVSVRLPDGTLAQRMTGTANGPDHIDRSISTTDGLLRFQRLVAGSHHLSVTLDLGWGELDGYSQERVGIEVAAGRTTQIELEFGGGATLRVRVHGAGFAAYGERFLVSALKLDEPEVGRFFHDYTNYGVGTTTLIGIPPGEYDVYTSIPSGVAHYRVAKLVRIVGNETVDLDFDVTDRMLTATVTDSGGRPIESARVGVRSRGVATAGSLGVDSSDLWRNGRSDGEGHAWICGFPAGAIEYVIERDGFARLDGVIEVDPSRLGESLEHRFVMEQEGLLAVAVRDRAGATLENASLLIESPGRRRLDLFAREQLRWSPDGTGADGRALFHGLGTGEYTLHAAAAGYFPQAAKVSCTCGTAIDLDISLRGLAPYVVRLRDAHGAPLRDAAFALRDLESDDMVADWLYAGRLAGGPRTTDHDGVIRFEALPLGRYRLEAPGITAEVEVGAEFDEDEIATIHATP